MFAAGLPHGALVSSSAGLLLLLQGCQKVTGRAMPLLWQTLGVFSVAHGEKPKFKCQVMLTGMSAMQTPTLTQFKAG